MRVVEKIEKSKNKNIFLIMIGDGRTEIKILPLIFERYNGKNLISFCPWSPTLQPGAGFGILRALPLLSEGLQNFIIILDKEHLNNKKLSKIIKKKLEEINAIYENGFIKNLGEGALKVQCKIVENEINLFIAVNGSQKRIEECLSKLIQFETKIRVRSSKEIWKDIKNNNLNINKIIENAAIENIKKSFPNLNAILELIEKNDH